MTAALTWDRTAVTVTRAAWNPDLHPRGPGGRFYHGTTSRLVPGDYAAPGHHKNFGLPGRATHIYFTESPDQARKYADYIARENGGTPRVYEVEPEQDAASWHLAGGRMSPQGWTDREFSTPGRLRVIREVHRPAKKKTARAADRYGWVRAAVVVTRPPALTWDRAAVQVTPPPGALLGAARWEPFAHPRDARGRFAPSSTLGPDHIPWLHSTQQARASELRPGDVVGAFTITGVEHGSAKGTTRLIFSGGARVTVRDDYRPTGVRRASYGGESFFSKKATHHADPDIKDITSIHGHRLHVADDGLGWDTSAVQRHLRGMQAVPPLHQRFLARSRVEFWIGTKPTTEQDQMGRLSKVHPPGYPAGDTYDQCAALFSWPQYDTTRKPLAGRTYNPPMTSPGKIILGNQTGSGSVNTAAHEMGHALDAFLGEDVFWRGTGAHLSMLSGFGVIHDRIASRSVDVPGQPARFGSDWAVNPYYVQQGTRGRSEAFAEAYAAWVQTARRPSKHRAEEIMDALGFVPTPAARANPAVLRAVMAAKRQMGADLIAFYDGLDAQIKGARKRLPPPRMKAGH